MGWIKRIINKIKLEIRYRKRLKELHGGGDHDGSMPQISKLSRRRIVKLGLVVMGSDDFSGVLVARHKGFSIDVDRLVDNVRERQDDDDTAQAFVLGHLQ